MQSASGCAGFQAANLAATADKVVVENGEVAYFSGETGLTVVELSAKYHSHAQAPAEVDEYHIFVGILAQMHIFSVGHRPGVVFDVHRHFQLLLEENAHRNIVAYEIGQRIALFRINPSGEAYAYSQNLVPVYACFGNFVLDALADFLERIGICFQNERNLRDESQQIALEVSDGKMEMLSGNVNAYKITGIRIEPINAGTSSALGADLALILQKSAFYHIQNGLRYGRNTDIEALAEIRDAVGIVFYAKPQNVFFYRLQLRHIFYSFDIVLTHKFIKNISYI